MGDDVVSKPSLEIVKQRPTAVDVGRWRNPPPASAGTADRPVIGAVAVPGLLAFPQGSKRMVGKGVDHESDVGTD